MLTIVYIIFIGNNALPYDYNILYILYNMYVFKVLNT